jgi:flagellar protein FlgJ
MDNMKAMGLRAGTLLNGMQNDNKLKSIESKFDQGNKDKSVEERQKAAADFEALLVGQMFKEMWKNTEGAQEGNMFTSEQESIYRDMLNEELAKEIAEKQSIGIKDIILKNFK